jgi:hypothetical protein
VLIEKTSGQKDRGENNISLQDVWLSILFWHGSCISIPYNVCFIFSSVLIKKRGRSKNWQPNILKRDVVFTSVLPSPFQNTYVKMKLFTGTWKDPHNSPFPARFIHWSNFFPFQRKERHERKLFIGSHSMNIRTKQSSDKNEFNESSYIYTSGGISTISLWFHCGNSFMIRK